MIWLCVSSHCPLRLFVWNGLLASASGSELTEAVLAPDGVMACDRAIGGVALGATVVFVSAVRASSAIGSDEGRIDAGVSLM